ncbi:MAG: HAD family hydrolase [Chloroflexi bacterium]|nr:HAD family hydrolase [Chloroflexota bacterium]
MIQGLLLDLDGTLLINDMDTFGRFYFKAIAKHMASLLDPDLFMSALMSSTEAMYQNDGRGGTNVEVFQAHFFELTQADPAVIMPALNEFYQTTFQDLDIYTERDPAARRLVEWAISRGLKLAVATQPLFPLEAILTRLRWAGVSADEFHYDLITSYEVMRTCKPHPLYFRHVAASLQLDVDQCCMVGDSVEADLPAGEVGMRTYWVVRDLERITDRVAANGRGTLDHLIYWLEHGGNDVV